MAVDIHALEIEFAKNPNLNACIPLCRAYLDQQRYMEAMVVCKKGIKSEPDDPRGPATLAEVYIIQGKIPKADQELKKLFEKHPHDPRGLELMGRVLLEQGDKAAAIEHLQTALQLNSALKDAPGLLDQLGAPRAPVPSPPPAAEPALATEALSVEVATGMDAAQPTMTPPPMPRGTSAGLGSTAVAAVANDGDGRVASEPAVRAPQKPPARRAQEGHRAENDVDVAQTDLPGDKKLEHVNDFFAPDTLGFANDGSHIETAGPGRLTILGFVPKSTGSIRTTIIALVVLVLLAGFFIAYQVWHSRLVQRKAELFSEVVDALRDDVYYRYKEALIQIQAIKALNSPDALTLGSEAYVWAVLALDHGEQGALEKARALLMEAKDVASGKENKYLVAASAMVAYLEERYDEGVAESTAVLDRGGTNVLLYLEAYRLRAKTAPEDQSTLSAFSQLREYKREELRALSFLGWYYYSKDDYTRADANFDIALRVNKNHIRSLIGVSLVDLDRGIGLDERQKTIEENLKRVFALPADELSRRDLALAHFARAQLLQWQGQSAAAAEDYEQAYEIDPKNPLFDYRRGLQLLSQGDASRAVAFLKKAAAKDPNDVAALNRLARAQTQAGDFQAAKSSLARAKELADDDKRLVLLEAELLREQRQYQDARDLYRSIKQTDGASIHARSMVGVASTYREAGNAAKAVQFMQNAMENTRSVGKRTKALMWEELGRGFEATRSRDQAIEAYQTCIDTYAYYADCHCRLASATGRGAEATRSAQNCVRIDPRGKLVSKIQNLLR